MISIASIMFFLKNRQSKKAEESFKEFSDLDVIRYSEMYRLPEVFVRKIGKLSVDNVEKRYMLEGAMFLFREKPLLGDGLNLNDPLAYEISQYLISKGVAIQYTNQKGMILVKTLNN